MKLLNFTKYEIATFIAILFHLCGFIGIFTAKHDWFVLHTPVTLVIMFALIIWTQSDKNVAFFVFLVIGFASGMLTEIIGVNSSTLFGNYSYGTVLGPQIKNVPWLIGINWVTIIYCCGVVLATIQTWFQQKLTAAGGSLSPKVQWFSFILDGAMLATFFDYILEPVAVKLGYWKWLGDGSVPGSNFLSWFVISAVLLAVFKLLSFSKHNQFAVHLLIIELLFFGALRTFL